jgi:hypothetical protein
VAIFAGGAGTADAAGKAHGAGSTLAEATSIAIATAPMTPIASSSAPAAAETTIPANLLASPTATLPAMGVGKSSPPNPVDDIKVLADGTFGGQHWRLVRDRFVTGDGGATGAGTLDHLPMSQMGRAGVESCEFTGMQWGDRAPGTLPDFDAGGNCGPGDIFSPTSGGITSLGQSTPEGEASSVTTVSGSLNARKIVSVTLSSEGQTSGRQPVIALPGDSMGYFVFFVKPWTRDHHPTFTVSGYDAQGQVVASMDNVYR